MTSTTVCFVCGATFARALPVGSTCRSCAPRLAVSGPPARWGEPMSESIEVVTIQPGDIVTARIEPFEEWVVNLEGTAASTRASSAGPSYADRRHAYLDEVEAARVELEPVIAALEELGREPDEGAVVAARTLLPAHSPEQLARIGEFGCSSLSLVDRPCGMCADCTPEDRLVPPLFAVADLPGFDDVAARKLAELEIALDEGVREPAPQPRPRPWLLPVMVCLYPVALVVALTTEVVGGGADMFGAVARWTSWRGVVRVLQRVLLVLAGVLAVAVVLGCVIAVGAFVVWLWSFLGWWTVPLVWFVVWLSL